MKKVIFLLLSCLFLCVGADAQSMAVPSAPASQAKSDEKPKRQIFRANKGQITEVQKMLKTKGLYSGEAVGKLDDTTRASIKLYQKDNGLKQTGTLNRATLEKMGIELTDKQKLMPVSPNSYASADGDKKSTTDTKPKRVIFRATKDQIADAQKLLKQKGMYTGDETGKLDDATRDGLKKFQEASGIKVTGTLNKLTLEKMGIELNDKQKGDVVETK
jgi:Putative peptidoglycan-binding domain-containing protein